tara:strand:- start:684 stop:1409 length:726 start_codon:yes stop_codon:yes gene_type:complete
MEKLYIIFVLMFLFALIIFYKNIYLRKKFHSCSDCEKNKYFNIDIKLPNKSSINEIEKLLKKGTLINPKSNFNNAQGKKIDSLIIPQNIKKFYMTDKLRKEISEIIGEEVYYAPDSEKYRIFSRIYDNPNDFLDWHYDNNFTKGNRYTLAIPIFISKGNTSEFMIKDRKTKEEIIVPMEIGKGVIYNGSEVYHKISKQTKNNKRIVIIIPFYTNNTKSLIGVIREVFRNFTNKHLEFFTQS